MPISVAFQTTQLTMKTRFINPYQWAGFILIE
jgi:CHAT domain-containing protein